MCVCVYVHLCIYLLIYLYNIHLIVDLSIYLSMHYIINSWPLIMAHVQTVNQTLPPWAYKSLLHGILFLQLLLAEWLMFPIPS